MRFQKRQGGDVRNPPKASVEERSALLDIEARLTALENKEEPKPVIVTPDAPLPGEDLEVASDLRVGNDARIEGSVSAPHLYEGLIKVVPTSIGSEAQRTINMASSLAIAPGGLSADSVRCRQLDVTDVETRLGPDPTYVVLEDDFIFSRGATTGLIGELGWNYFDDHSGTGTLYVGEVNHPGAYYIGDASMDAVGKESAIYANSAVFPFLNGVTSYKETWIIRGSSIVSYGAYRMGMADNVTWAASTNQIVFEVDNTAYGDTNFRAITTSASSSTTTDTGVDCANLGWYRLEMHYTPEAVKFYIDGVLVATHTTNIPTTNTLTPTMQIKFLATLWSVLVIDYYSLAYSVPR